MMLSEKMRADLRETRRIVSEIKSLSPVDDLSDRQLCRRALLLAKLRELAPPHRFIWRDGAPSLDLLEGLERVASKKRRKDESKKGYV